MPIYSFAYWQNLHIPTGPRGKEGHVKQCSGRTGFHRGTASLRRWAAAALRQPLWPTWISPGTLVISSTKWDRKGISRKSGGRRSRRYLRLSASPTINEPRPSQPTLPGFDRFATFSRPFFSQSRVRLLVCSWCIRCSTARPSPATPGHTPGHPAFQDRDTSCPSQFPIIWSTRALPFGNG